MKKTAFGIACGLILFLFIFPIFWIYLTSFKGRPDIYNVDASKLFIFSMTTENYPFVFAERDFLSDIINTAIVSVSSTILVMAISLPAAYSFARFNTGGGQILFTTISTRMFPVAVAAIPFFLFYRALSALDTLWGLTLLYMYFNVSFATFLLYGFFREIPPELEHAAMTDGYGRIAILRRVIFPLIKPGAAITTVFCLIFAWNEFLFSFLFSRNLARTISVGLSLYWSALDVQWGAMAAAAGMAILPTLVASWLMQRYIIRGLTFGAVKG